MRKGVESAEAVVVKIAGESRKEQRAKGPRECDRRKSSMTEAKRVSKSEGATTTVATRAREKPMRWNRRGNKCDTRVRTLARRT